MTKHTTSDQADHYIEGIGRRKTAIARVRLFPKKAGFTKITDAAQNALINIRGALAK